MSLIQSLFRRLLLRPLPLDELIFTGRLQIIYCFLNLLTPSDRHLFTFPYPPHPRYIIVARFKSDRILTTRRYFQDAKSPWLLISVEPLFLRLR
ncbi:hypothetical protein Bca4012_029369 [Brassica carinata]